MYRSRSLENNELMALCRSGRYLYGVQDRDYTSEDEEPDSEFDRRGDREMRNALSMENCALPGEEKEGEEGHVYFSNQEYYWRLEELKKSHLRNMAELEKMYIGRNAGGHQNYHHGLSLEANSLAEEQATPTRRLQRINSQEELDFHDTSSGSDQSELSNGPDSVGELELYMDSLAGMPSPDKTFERDRLVNPETSPTRMHYILPAKHVDAGCLKRTPAKTPAAPGARVPPASRPTVPKPFRMTLREAERKRRQVRTRSQVELENALLQRELEELRECRKKFRATPAPAHTGRPLVEVTGRRAVQRRREENNGCDSPVDGPPPPFSFLERERRKKEAKMAAQLGNLGPREASSAFRARPLPCAVYCGPRHAGTHSSAGKTVSTAKSPSATGAAQVEVGVQLEAGRVRLPRRLPGRCPMNKSVKQHMEVSIEMVKERGWSYVCA